MPKPIAKYVPKNSNTLIEKFINCLMIGGKKSTARKVFTNAMETMKKRTKDDPFDVFERAIINVTPIIEVRPRRVGGAVYQVPVEVPPHRQQSLAIRWLISSARDKKGSPMAERLALELLDASANQGGAVKKKENIQKMAQANKAFAHLAK
ncbi:30S ribosomal protein S7 [Candidatus Peribacteria bacterium]|jgi:small subunit ribosomal protein S7|nr:30S ribosomal protein S7 [Candidatus Peribacteria bacterium]MBT4021610.1 30S ribosomal protein S7 [Candidatus Peribacteria bacterium]MBT4240495.1 30S ribosomal protein S7 [Candidatus Peribacteria bacterium]MBT4474324.1 30S ribosomal protein S7 [Candidatus Peribacteria bacterium]